MQITKEFNFLAKVWLYPGLAAWHFITVPKNISDNIKTLFGGLRRGFGSLPVRVNIGKTSWKTSIFPDSKAGAYMLPLKNEVRKRESIKVGDEINIVIEILV